MKFRGVSKVAQMTRMLDALGYRMQVDVLWNKSTKRIEGVLVPLGTRTVTHDEVYTYLFPLRIEHSAASVLDEIVMRGMVDRLI